MVAEVLHCFIDLLYRRQILTAQMLDSHVHRQPQDLVTLEPCVILEYRASAIRMGRFCKQDLALLSILPHSSAAGK